jgi:hypothetical protein
MKMETKLKAFKLLKMESTQVGSRTIKSRAKGRFYGIMGKCMMGNGLTGKSMARGHGHHLMVIVTWANGSEARFKAMGSIPQKQVLFD